MFDFFLDLIRKTYWVQERNNYFMSFSRVKTFSNLFIIYLDYFLLSSITAQEFLILNTSLNRLVTDRLIVKNLKVQTGTHFNFSILNYL